MAGSSIEIGGRHFLIDDEGDPIVGPFDSPRDALLEGIIRSGSGSRALMTPGTQGSEPKRQVGAGSQALTGEKPGIKPVTPGPQSRAPRQPNRLGASPSPFDLVSKIRELQRPFDQQDPETQARLLGQEEAPNTPLADFAADLINPSELLQNIATGGGAKASGALLSSLMVLARKGATGAERKALKKLTQESDRLFPELSGKMARARAANEVSALPKSVQNEVLDLAVKRRPGLVEGDEVAGDLDTFITKDLSFTRKERNRLLKNTAKQADQSPLGREILDEVRFDDSQINVIIKDPQGRTGALGATQVPNPARAKPSGDPRTAVGISVPANTTRNESFVKEINKFVPFHSTPEKFAETGIKNSGDVLLHEFTHALTFGTAEKWLKDRKLLGTLFEAKSLLPTKIQSIIDRTDGQLHKASEVMARIMDQARAIQAKGAAGAFNLTPVEEDTLDIAEMIWKDTKALRAAIKGARSEVEGEMSRAALRTQLKTGR